MNESYIKIEIDDELLENYTSGFYEESFDSLKGKKITLKRFNLICEKVFDRIAVKNGIFSYIFAYIFLEKKYNNKHDYIQFYSESENQSNKSLFEFSIWKKNKSYIRETIRRITLKYIDYKFRTNKFLILSFIFFLFSSIWFLVTTDEVLTVIETFFAALLSLYLYLYLLSRQGQVKIISNEYLKYEEDCYVELIFILFQLKNIENKAIKRGDKKFHLLLSLENYSTYADPEFQKKFADLVFDYIVRNENLSITMNNSHPDFLVSMLSNYQNRIANETNTDMSLKEQFTIIQSYGDPSLEKYFEHDEEEEYEELTENENYSYYLKSVRIIDFPATGDLPLSLIPISSEEYAVERSADKLSKTKLDITKSLATELSHEIRNPIGVIQLIAENILSGKIENPNDQKTYLRDILKQTDRIDEVLKYFSSLETNKKSGSKELSINKIILDAFHFFQEQLESNSVHVEYQLDQELPTIHGVSESLGNVIVNLIRNSIYALTGKENKKILVRTFTESDTIKIEVTDNGCGIDSDHRPKIFSPFFTTKSTGSGIGLWLSHRTITEEFGGKFTFSSEENKGTTFFISLPIEGEKA